MDDTKKDAGNITVNITPYPTTDGIVLKTAKKACGIVNAYYIPRSAIHSKFIGERPSELFDNYGIYFLYRNENKEKGLDAKIYVGQVGKRPGGIIQRLKEHDKETIRYENDWDCALVVRSDTEFNEDIVSELESIYHYKLKNIEVKLNKQISLNKNIPNGSLAEVDARIIEDIDYYLDTYIPTVFAVEEPEIQEDDIVKMKTKKQTEDLRKGACNIPEFTTPTDIVKQMVDMLPDSVWNPDTKFLDPACKGGEFLKELFNRLMDADSLKAKYPDKTARTLHILNEQLYGVALSKESRAKALETLGGYGNIILVPLAGSVGSSLVSGLLRIEEEDTEYYKKLQIGLKEVAYLSADSGITHYYVKIGNDFLKVVEASFRSMIKQTEFTRRFGDEMKFDVVIGNPPYQEITGGGATGSGGRALYDKFLDLGCDIGKSLCMIVKNNWISADTLKDCRDKLLNYGLCRIINYPNIGDVFKGVSVAVNILYAEKGYTGKTKCIEKVGTSVVGNYAADLKTLGLIPSTMEQYNIVLKVKQRMKEAFGDRAATKLPFGIESNGRLGAQGFEPFVDMRAYKDGVYNTGLMMLKGEPYWMYIREAEVYKNIQFIQQYNVVCGNTLHKSYNCVTNIQKLNPNEVCSGSFSVLYSDPSELVIDNAIKYIKSRLFRFLTYTLVDNMCRTSVTRLKLVPNQDFTSSSDIDWSQSISDIDNQLYKKYNLSPEEIAYIEKTIKPMS